MLIIISSLSMIQLVLIFIYKFVFISFSPFQVVSCLYCISCYPFFNDFALNFCKTMKLYISDFNAFLQVMNESLYVCNSCQFSQLLMVSLSPLFYQGIIYYQYTFLIFMHNLYIYIFANICMFPELII